MTEVTIVAINGHKVVFPGSYEDVLPRLTQLGFATGTVEAATALPAPSDELVLAWRRLQEYGPVQAGLYMFAGDLADAGVPNATQQASEIFGQAISLLKAIDPETYTQFYTEWVRNYCKDNGGVGVLQATKALRNECRSLMDLPEARKIVEAALS